MNGLQQAWGDWRRRRASARHALAATRWVVIDVETSGLDILNDRLIAAAAVGVRWQQGAPVLNVEDSFEVVLQAPPGLALDAVARRNILLHGIGQGEQGGGVEPVAALKALHAFVDGAPCLAFHAAFDAGMLDREWRRLRVDGGLGWPEPWLDLAVLARALYPEWPERRTLDQWLEPFALAASQRHRASSDAWVTAELLQCLWPRWRAKAAGRSPWACAHELLEARRWLG
ncbi:DNA polymerase-3 subunit epsilon [Inhella inkyongensis]|uniref:DNA polymerase-3 subunit epsilon n=1 Tax=Inhella inkyongensis TaxID=392593 RepID=A0A840RZS5_9BURK|nr:3'-5' exonuclease [Inhella inkyongensis]MBB5204297.1 DNA polymerase-3 subunit epsilon [Inhella inkyongensis]